MTSRQLGRGSFPIAVSQRLDISLTFPQGAGAYPVLAALEEGRGAKQASFSSRAKPRSGAFPILPTPLQPR